MGVPPGGACSKHLKMEAEDISCQERKPSQHRRREEKTEKPRRRQQQFDRWFSQHKACAVEEEPAGRRQLQGRIHDRNRHLKDLDRGLLGLNSCRGGELCAGSVGEELQEVVREEEALNWDRWNEYVQYRQ